MDDITLAQPGGVDRPRAAVIVVPCAHDLEDRPRRGEHERGVADVLKREGYIWDWQEEEAAPATNLRLELKYGPNGERVIQHLKRVSTPGRRVFSKAKDLPPILNGLGIRILSTSRGVISDREARQRNVGGEVLCEIW